jgi:2-polyprenyl-3-methyl-5-hydroxy-6-metoxy-1,4-benzoquinol methylase
VTATRREGFDGPVGPLDAQLDRWVGAAVGVVSWWAQRSPTGLALARLRADAAGRALEHRHLALRELAVVFEDERPGDHPEISDAKNRLARLGADALEAMRRDVDRRAGRSWRAPLARLDRAWRSTSTVELIDRPDFAESKRVRLMAHLDEMNVMLGAYAAFLDVLRPYLRTDRPTRVLDLAAGHGGFLLEVARLARDEGLALELVASDIAEEYLAIGRAHAEAQGLPVRFVVQDALDTTNLEKNAYDVVVCTQSLHHFPPGQVSVLVHEALRIASSAVVLIDGARSKAGAPLISLLGVVRYRDLPFAHDSWVSLRKFFSPEELGLLARIGAEASPGGPRHVTSRLLPPGHLATVVTV